MYLTEEFGRAFIGTHFVPVTSQPSSTAITFRDSGMGAREELDRFCLVGVREYCSMLF